MASAPANIEKPVKGAMKDSKVIRSKIMSAIKAKDTKPEIYVRKLLHARGFRFLLHDKRLPGKPDIVLPKYNAIILVNGCFWHGHSCHIFKEPKQEKWRIKIERNTMRDKKNLELYRTLGWRVLTIWECALFGKTRLDETILAETMAQWLINHQKSAQITGKESR